jgi:hypothetical protein
MLPGQSSHLDQFIRALHRRLIALRIIEHAGIGLLAGCAIGAVFVGIMLYRNQNAWSVGIAALIVGALGGMLWGVAHLPSILTAATEADRQLRTADLLATAWHLKEKTAREAIDPWTQSVVAIADQRCSGLRPSAVLLHRFGVRAWGGISLAVAFVGTLAAMSSEPLRAGTGAVAGDISSAQVTTIMPRRPIVELTADGSVVQRRVEQTPASDRGESQQPEVENASAGDESSDSENRNAPSMRSSAGRGEGQTKSPQAQQPERDSSSPVAAEPLLNRSSQSAGGVGPSARSFAEDERRSGGAVVNSHPAGVVPPWRDAAWPSSVQSALRNVQAGHVPDEARDLVRGYFDPTSLPPENGVSERP